MQAHLDLSLFYRHRLSMSICFFCEEKQGKGRFQRYLVYWQKFSLSSFMIPPTCIIVDEVYHVYKRSIDQNHKNRDDSHESRSIHSISASPSVGFVCLSVRFGFVYLWIPVYLSVILFNHTSSESYCA